MKTKITIRIKTASSSSSVAAAVWSLVGFVVVVVYKQVKVRKWEWNR